MEYFFRIEMLPAQHGDALWIEYGTQLEVHRLLIDGGPLPTYGHIVRRIDRIAGNRSFDLIALTHVDADHIEGLIRLFADRPMPFTVKKILFNGWHQMSGGGGVLDSVQGELLSSLLARRTPQAWRYDSQPCMVPTEGPLPVITLPLGMKLTVLSPTAAKMAAMAADWRKRVRKAGFEPGDLDAAWRLLTQRRRLFPEGGLLDSASTLESLLAETFHPDQALANGSSLAFLAEFEGKSALLLGDAHADVLQASIQRLCADRGIEKLEVDVMKVSHHGSRHNTSAALLDVIRCHRYLVSTSGARFQHPDRECMALLVGRGNARELVFNYESDYTREWLHEDVQRQFQYRARVRSSDESSIAVDL